MQIQIQGNWESPNNIFRYDIEPFHSHVTLSALLFVQLEAKSSLSINDLVFTSLYHHLTISISFQVSGFIKFQTGELQAAEPRWIIFTCLSIENICSMNFKTKYTWYDEPHCNLITVDMIKKMKLITYDWLILLALSCSLINKKADILKIEGLI